MKIISYLTSKQGTKMPFPETPRVIYAHNPLVEVLCQFRFPPNLSIETELPAEFQKSIREDYPLYTEKLELQFKVPEDQGVTPMVSTSLPPAVQRKNHEFLSADGQWKINMTREFIAFSSLAYRRWEKFKEHVVGPFELFTSIYKPPFLTRLGLRYQDLIVRSKLGLDAVPWTELLKPHILGISATEDVGKNVQDFNHVTEIKLEDGVSTVRIIDGLAKDPRTNETCYSIDSDFFLVQKIEVKEALSKLDYFNQRGSRLIQWCITEKLHNAMEPELI